MRRACIDIGSNTTRLLVAEVGLRGVEPIDELRAFTNLGHALELEGHLSETKLAEVLDVVAAQLRRARGLGAQEVSVVATAAVRRASNGAVLVARLHDELGLSARVLSPAEEARLAFLGAAARLAGTGPRDVAVVDVGGGSCELAVGSPPADVRWSASVPIGSGTLTARHFEDDPPAPGQLEAARAAVTGVLAELEAPGADELVAVGGSATSLRRFGGDTLELPLLQALLADATSLPSAELAVRASLEPERARLLPAGLLILGALGEKFDRPIRIGTGGVREGVLIEAGR